MVARSFTLVPATYVYFLRPDPGTVGEDTAAASSGTQVLLQPRRNTGYMDGHWACGASGHAETTESVLEVALRETGEEPGIGAKATDLSALTAIHRINDLGGAIPEQRIDLFFTLRTWTGTSAVHEPTKNADLYWFPLAGLPEAVPSHECHVLELLAASLDGGKPVPPIITFGFGEGQDIDRYDITLPHWAQLARKTSMAGSSRRAWVSPASKAVMMRS